MASTYDIKLDLDNDAKQIVDDKGNFDEAEKTAAEGGNTKPTTTKSSAGEGVDDTNDLRRHYRPTIASKNVIIQRGSQATPRNNMGSDRSSASFRSPSPTLMPGTSMSFGRSPDIGGGLRGSREQAKKDMQELNERLANFIEKVRFFHAQNRRLADELEKLKSKWGKETSNVKTMYQAELDEARKLLDNANREKGHLEMRVASLEEVLEELKKSLEDSNKNAESDREKVDNLIQQIVDVEAENNLLRRRFHALESDRDRDKKLIQQLREQLSATRVDLDNETLMHIDAENQRQTLEEELEFLKNLHDQEMKELAALAYRDTTSENREFWKGELGLAMREIQQVYDDRMDALRAEQESYYNLKAQELRAGANHNNMEVIHAREEGKRLRGQLGLLRDRIADLDAKNNQLSRDLEGLRREKNDIERRLNEENGDIKGELNQLKGELDALTKELELTADTKLSLELEIIAYRKLLEGEENRVGLRQMVDILATDQPHTALKTPDQKVPDQGALPDDQLKVPDQKVPDQGALPDDQTYTAFKVPDEEAGVLPAKTTYKRSAKGPIAIGEVSIEGTFVQLENSGHSDEDLGEWRLVRNIDGDHELHVILPQSFVLKAGEKVKIWAKGQKAGQETGPADLEVDQPSWGVGSKVVLTTLLNTSGEERATHTQTTVFG